MFKTNLLLYGDNLEFLRDPHQFPTASVDLIYLDPPFNSNATYNVLFKEVTGEPSAAQIKAFDDTWTWDAKAAQEEAELLADTHTPSKLAALVPTLHGFLGPSAMLAYLVRMALRLVHLRRVLKDTGSLYLHCDPTASHYLKLVLDGVFEPKNFRSEIVWRRTGSHNKAERWAPIHDTILFCTASDTFTWNSPRLPYMLGHVKEHFVKDGDRWRTNYYGNVLTGAGTRGGESGQPWQGIDPTAKGRHWAIPGALLADLDEDLSDLGQHEKLDRLLELGHVTITPGQAWPMYQRYVKPGEGPRTPDIWAFQPYTGGTVFDTDYGIDEDVRWLSPRDQERLGYQTQKPLSLLKRVILASSRPGDTVLDPFCGCGTTIDAVETLNREYHDESPRRWIGIDITHLAVNLIKYRLTRFDPAPVYDVRGEPIDAAGAEQLFKDDAYQFQFWACGLVGARPAGASAQSPKKGKKGADRGIDGARYFVDDNTGPKTILVQVKGGSVGAAQVRDFRGTVEREKAAMGMFITLKEPTKPMRQEAASADVYRSPSDKNGTTIPRIQIVTVSQLLSGGSPRQPAGVLLPSDASKFDRTFKKGKRHDEGSLFVRESAKAGS